MPLICAQHEPMTTLLSVATERLVGQFFNSTAASPAQIAFSSLQLSWQM